MGDAATASGERVCDRCGERLPPAAFDRASIGAHTDGGLGGWCNACYRDPYRAIGEALPDRPAAVQVAAPPWAGRRARAGR